MQWFNGITNFNLVHKGYRDPVTYTSFGRYVILIIQKIQLNLLFPITFNPFGGIIERIEEQEGRETDRRSRRWAALFTAPRLPDLISSLPNEQVYEATHSPSSCEFARIGHPSIINTFNYRIFMNSAIV